MKKFLFGIALLAAAYFAAPVADRVAQEAGAAVYLPIYITSAGGGCANIDPDIVAARTSGTAPLYVAFDASATTDSGVTSRPFHDLEYNWDFGDTGAGTWTLGTRGGSNSKNAAQGPIAGHVFETPGSYTVELDVFDGTNTCPATVGITVADPDVTYSGTKTVCFSTSGTFTGCPAGATQTTSSDFDAALSSCVATTKRCLFRRTETFNASAQVTITATGPGTIGAYGSGALPIVNVTSNLGDNPVIEFGSSSTVNQKDWRVMDLSFTLNSSAEAVGMGGGFDQVTLLRLTARSCGDACIFYNSAVLNVGSNPHLFDQAAVVDCDLAQPESWGLFLNASNFAVMGNKINSATGSHSLRISIAINGVISNNELGPNGVGSAGNHVLKLHGPPFGSATDGVPSGTATRKVVVSYNKLTPGNNSTNNWTMAIDPQDDAENERIQDIVVEYNAFTAGTNTGMSISLQGVNVSIRGNVSNTTGAADGVFINIERRSNAAPAPTGVTIFNNSFYTSTANVNSSDTPFILIRSDVASGGVTTRNNLGYSPNASGTPLMILDQGSGNTADHNTINSQMKTNPNYTTVPPVLLGDYKPTSGYALGAGASVPNWHDALGIAWSPTWDIGAIKH